MPLKAYIAVFTLFFIPCSVSIMLSNTVKPLNQRLKKNLTFPHTNGSKHSPKTKSKIQYKLRYHQLFVEIHIHVCTSVHFAFLKCITTVSVFCGKSRRLKSVADVGVERKPTIFIDGASMSADSAHIKCRLFKLLFHFTTSRCASAPTQSPWQRQHSG